LVLHIIIGGLMILVPPEVLSNYGLDQQIRLIGAGAILAGVLLLIPRTSSLGIFLTSSFWRGPISIHIAHDEPYIFQVVVLFPSWLGAYLRNPAMVSRYPDRRGTARRAMAEAEPAVA
jgi:hypothetical protein